MYDIFSLAKRLNEESSVPFQFDPIDKCLYYPVKETPIYAVKESSELGQFYLKKPLSTITASENTVISLLKKSYEENKDKVDSFIASLTECEKKEASSSEENKDKEDINHPERYGGDTTYECVKVLKNWVSKEEYRGFLHCNAIKYLCRLGKKDEAIKELKKAAWYVNKLIESYEEENEAGN